MRLVNETGAVVEYWITNASNTECGSISADSYVDLPEWDNQQNVNVSFGTPGSDTEFTMICGSTGEGQQVEMAVVAEVGDPASGATGKAKS
jgi:hypothetical protein